MITYTLGTPATAHIFNETIEGHAAIQIDIDNEDPIQARLHVFIEDDAPTLAELLSAGAVPRAAADGPAGVNEMRVTIADTEYTLNYVLVEALVEPAYGPATSGLISTAIAPGADRNQFVEDMKKLS